MGRHGLRFGRSNRRRGRCGGTGGGFAANEKQLREICADGLRSSGGMARSSDMKASWNWRNSFMETRTSSSVPCVPGK